MCWVHGKGMGLIRICFRQEREREECHACECHNRIGSSGVVGGWGLVFLGFDWVWSGCIVIKNWFDCTQSHHPVDLLLVCCVWKLRSLCVLKVCEKC